MVGLFAKGYRIIRREIFVGLSLDHIRGMPSARGTRMGTGRSGLVDGVGRGKFVDGIFWEKFGIEEQWLIGGGE